MSDVRVRHSTWSSRIGTAIVVLAVAALAAAPFWADRAELHPAEQVLQGLPGDPPFQQVLGVAGRLPEGRRLLLGEHAPGGAQPLYGVHAGPVATGTYRVSLRRGSSLA